MFIYKFLDLRKIDNSFEIFNFFSRKRKVQFFLISIIAIFAAIFESLTIGLLIPFISLLIASESSNKYNDFLYLIEKYNFTSLSSSVFIFFIFIGVIITGSFIKILYLFLQSIYGSSIVKDFNKLILKNSVLMPYENFLNVDSSIYISAILNKSNFISRYIRNLLSFLVTLLSFFSIIIICGC
mgnify:CR=1 FL=1